MGWGGSDLGHPGLNLPIDCTDVFKYGQKVAKVRHQLWVLSQLQTAALVKTNKFKYNLNTINCYYHYMHLQIHLQPHFEYFSCVLNQQLKYRYIEALEQF